MRQATPDILGDVFGERPQTTMVRLNAIRIDGGTQMRAGLDMTTVAEYAEYLVRRSNGGHGWGDFPPVVLFYDGSDYWVGDGFHRLAAAREKWGEPSAAVPADVRSGTRRDAILFAAGANASHGLRRTNADKRRAIETLLRDGEWSKWSNGEIARRCAVDEKTVRLQRESLEATSEIPKSNTRIGSDGRAYHTTNIGRVAPTQPIAQPQTPDLSDPALVRLEDLPVVATTGPVFMALDVPAEPLPAWAVQEEDEEEAPVAAPTVADYGARLHNLRQFRAQFAVALSLLEPWGQATGHFTATLEAERGLQRIIMLTDNELKALGVHA